MSSSTSTTGGTVSSTARHKTRLAVPSGTDSSSRSTYGSGSGGGALSSLGTVMSPAQYLARLVDVQQMDVQSALDQMRTLCTLSPQRVYKTSYYRKQTKNHWARDDPAFCFLQMVFLALASIAYCVAFREDSLVSSTIGFAIKSILINWFGLGILIASIGREFANRHLTVHQSSSHVRQGVEWLYAFDIHCNAFFPLFVALYGLQFFLLPIVLGKSLLSLILANTLYAAAFSWYFYITHLGYRALPFLSSTEVFLFPIAGIMIVYLINLVGYPFGFGWNASRIMAHFYFD
eukprot:CAMPEP_0198282768 /NCGR_PEP_ID=MMETSP1449-20131203/2529_1 /TAXON_ID=420275 /ORGANISM="Attheya septentrionalis, Strain CCMP2084" /LENGTH=289 /DNA_ID=CAMNT_0043979163 /DNA_START=156 /DNA_END=1025 /DNA_ORIENTATION=+